MLKIAILEDEPMWTERFQQYLDKYQKEHEDFEFEATYFDRAKPMVRDYHPGYDLLFMDIRLPDMLGIDAARKIRERDSEVMIVFVTTMTQYAIDGYEVNAFDYILKPLRYDAFVTKMDRIRRILDRSGEGATVTIKTKTDQFYIKAAEIQYIEVSGHDLIFHMPDREISVWGSLSKFEQELNQKQFARCNACYLVNLRHVKSVSGMTVTVGEQDLSISKTKKKDFMSELAKYRGGSR